MTLTLRIANRDRLENGSPTELVLNNRGAIIGRSLTCEWSLPDDSRTLSGRHCEIQSRSDEYFLIDVSTNGTFLGDSEERLSGSHRVRPGDRFRMGPYLVEARLSGRALDRYQAEVSAQEAARRGPGWSDWEDVPGAARQSPPPLPAAGTSINGNDAWDMPTASRDAISPWADRAETGPRQATADEIFDSFAARNQVDWASASWSVEPGFDPFATGPADGDQGFAPLDPAQPDLAPIAAAAPARDPFGGPLGTTMPESGAGIPAPETSWPDPSPAPPAAGAALDPFPALDPQAQDGVSARSDVTQPTTLPDRAPRADPIAPPTATPTQPPLGADSNALYAALLGELGVASSAITTSPEDAGARTGRMLRRLLAGLMVLLEARARAKDEMGASATQLRFDGNNPLKFARNVDQALQMMLNPALRGYMESEQAIEDSFRDLQAHQIATLKAMQGALRETLDRFSPTSIKERAGAAGFLKTVLPGQREAALWKAYEKQFSGVAEGSAEAFLEVFSKEFRRAYEEAARGD